MIPPIERQGKPLRLGTAQRGAHKVPGADGGVSADLQLARYVGVCENSGRVAYRARAQHDDCLRSGKEGLVWSANGSIASVWPSVDDFRSSPVNGRHQIQ